MSAGGNTKPAFSALAFGDRHLVLQCTDGRVLAVGALSTLATPSPSVVKGTSSAGVPGLVSSKDDKGEEGGVGAADPVAAKAGEDSRSAAAGATASTAAAPAVAAPDPTHALLESQVAGFLAFQDLGGLTPEAAAEALCVAVGYHPALAWTDLKEKFGQDADVYRQSLVRLGDAAAY